MIYRKSQILLFKTDAQYTAEELANAKASANAEIGGYLDKALYREAEQTTIDGIIADFNSRIKSATTVDEVSGITEEAKIMLDSILTSAELKTNADANKEVLLYLNKAVAELEDTRFIGKEKKLVNNIVLPVMKAVITDGAYGSIIITPEYVKTAYDYEVGEAKKIYDSMSADIEKPAFEQKLAQLDMETQAFLKEYFL